MSDPSVSVVITSFNQRSFLSQAIDSALDQDMPVEVIVVDDGSCDGSDKVIASYGPRLKSIYQENSGACAARNTGLAAASSTYVKFLDGDDWLAPGCLAVQAAKLTRIGNPQGGSAVFGDVVHVDAKGEEITGLSARSAFPVILDLHSMITEAPRTSAPLHYRNDLERVGGFDNRVLRDQDYDLHMRLALTGVQFHYLPGCVYYYRQHNEHARISQATCSETSRSIVSCINRHISHADQLGLFNSDVRHAFSRRLNRRGMDAQRNGEQESSQILFEKAVRLHSDDRMADQRQIQF